MPVSAPTALVPKRPSGKGIWRLCLALQAPLAPVDLVLSVLADCADITHFERLHCVHRVCPPCHWHVLLIGHCALCSDRDGGGEQHRGVVRPGAAHLVWQRRTADEDASAIRHDQLVQPDRGLHASGARPRPSALCVVLADYAKLLRRTQASITGGPGGVNVHIKYALE